MNALEAMTRVLQVSETVLKEHKDPTTEAEVDAFNDFHTAVAVCTAMLNTALPIARYRCFVEVDDKLAKVEFTICGVRIDDITPCLWAIRREGNFPIRVVLFEQKQAGAEMVSGFQGKLRDPNFRTWLKNLPALENLPTVQ